MKKMKKKMMMMRRKKRNKMIRKDHGTIIAIEKITYIQNMVTSY